MRVLALDISTSSGWAIFEDGKPQDYGLIKHTVEGTYDSPDYPYNYYKMAEDMADELCSLAIRFYPQFIIVEETNKAKNRYHQKQLEYIHCLFVGRIKRVAKLETQCRLRYISTSAWRKQLGIGLSKDQRIFNKQIKVERDQHRQTLSDEILSKNHLQIAAEIELATGKREANKISKEWGVRMKAEVDRKMRKFRTKKNNKVVGKVNPKHLSINYVNEKFNMNFKTKDNDITDAICVGTAFIEMEKL